jgi:hypothetical protein
MEWHTRSLTVKSCFQAGRTWGVVVSDGLSGMFVGRWGERLVMVLLVGMLLDLRDAT